jgi:hypothetical protein
MGRRGFEAGAISLCSTWRRAERTACGRLILLAPLVASQLKTLARCGVRGEHLRFVADERSYLANSFWPEDMKDVASVASQCRIWLEDNTDAYEQQREWKKEKMKRSKRTSKTASPESNE